MANTFNTFPIRAAEKRIQTQRKALANSLSGKETSGLKQAIGAAQLDALEEAISLPRLPGIYGGERVTYTPREGHLRVGGVAVRPTR